MFRLLSLGTLVAIGLASRAGAGETLPTDADVRRAIVRGLPFVERDGLAWIDKRNCMSCHTVTFMLWAHTEAAAHGVPVDAKKLAEWTEWSMEKSLGARVFYKLDRAAVESVPEAVQPKLEKLVGVGFTHETELTAALTAVLTPAERKEHQPGLLKKAQASKKSEGNDGGSIETIAQLLLARDRAAAEPRDDFYVGTAELLVRLQNPNGTWTAGGQLPSRRWSRETADQTTTLWAILALASYDDPAPAVRKGVEKARAAVAKPVGDGNLEWLVARTLYEQKFGTPGQRGAITEQLLKRQNGDGGWSVLPSAESDAFSTGQSLYALTAAGVAPDDLAIRRGQKYLIDSQNADGSWSVAPALTSKGEGSRLKSLTPIWRNWGSSWATIGLAKSLPVPPKAGPR